MIKKPMSGLLITSLILIGLGTIGAILLAIDQYKGSENLKDQVIANKDSIIKNLTAQNRTLDETIKDQGAELKKKSDSINSLTQQVLDFSKTIDANTEAIRNIASNNSVISKQNNQIISIIKNEQKKRGFVSFEAKYDTYQMKLGFWSNEFSSARRTFPPPPNMFGYSNYLISVTKQNNQLLISLKLKDINTGKLIFELDKGKWNVDKNSVFSINYDSYGLEIIDKDDLVILQIDIIENVCTISGTTFYDDKYIFLRRNKEDIRLDKNDPHFFDKFRYYNVERIFHHTGENYLGKRTKAYIDEKEIIINQRKKIDEELKNYENLTREELINVGSSLIDRLKGMNSQFQGIDENSGNWLRFENLKSNFYKEYYDKGLAEKIKRITFLALKNSTKEKKIAFSKRNYLLFKMKDDNSIGHLIAEMEYFLEE